MIIIQLKGTPQPKARPRSANGIFYSPKSKWEKEIKKQLKKIKANQDIYFDSPIRVDITFFMPRPKNHFRTGKFSHLLKDSAPRIWHCKRPDRDNLDKAVLDVMTDTGILSDDCIVCDGRIKKRWASGEGSALVTIEKVEEVKR